MIRALLALLLLLAGPARADWDVYQWIMWHDRTPAQMAGLRALGFTGTKLRGTGGVVAAEDLAARRASGMAWFVENIATDFYAPYHRWTPGRAETWLFDAARARHAAGLPAFERTPSLSDPAALAAVAARLGAVVRSMDADRPLFYNLGDETGIADLSAAWDFDVSPASLAGFRAWLPGVYPDVAALNAQWGTDLAGWDAAVPMLTDAALAAENPSAWADFKAWMDVAFARALRHGTAAVHAASPHARSGLEGAQVPGWGGYDYGLIAGAVDVMEMYDSGHNLDIAHGLNPGLITLRTVFDTGAREAHATWSDLLRGGRGLVLWDERDDTVLPDGAPGPRGSALAPLVRDVRAVAPALLGTRPASDGVAILYSQASFRTRWLLDRRAGAAWTARDAERELDDNAWRAATRQAMARTVQVGIVPRWIASATALGPGEGIVLLPHAIALGDDEVAALRAFEARGGTVLADTEPGLFDAHSRRRGAPPLAGVALMPQVVRPDGAPDTPGTLDAWAALLGTSGRLVGPDGARAAGVALRRYAVPDGEITALHAMVPWGAPPNVTLVRPAAAWRCDLRAPGAAVWTDRAIVALDPIAPTILAWRATPGC